MVVVLGKVRNQMATGNKEEATIFLFPALSKSVRKFAETLKERHMLAHQSSEAIFQELSVCLASYSHWKFGL